MEGGGRNIRETEGEMRKEREEAEKCRRDGGGGRRHKEGVKEEKWERQG